MNTHEHFEELAALSAGGFLSADETAELREHAKTCGECAKAERDFGEVLCRGCRSLEVPSANCWTEAELSGRWSSQPIPGASAARGREVFHGRGRA